MSTAIVPYAARGAYYGMRWAGGLRRRQGIRYAARAGMSIGKFAYNNRGKIKRTVERFARARGRAAKKRRRSQNSNAYPTRPSSRRKVERVPDVLGGQIGFGPKRLDIKEIRFVSSGIGDNRRNSNQIYFKGFSCCVNLFNRNPYPIEVHWALVQFADEQATGEGPKVRAEFFRGSGPSENEGRTLTFTEDDVFDRRYLCNPLNPDNKRILAHRRWKVWGQAPASTSTEITGNRNVQASRDNHLKYQQYHKIGRVVKLDGGIDIENEKPFYKCMWWLPVDPADFDPTGNVQYDDIEKVYWKNVVS